MKLKSVPVEEYSGPSSGEDLGLALRGRRKPLVFRNLELGPSRSLWSVDYLSEKLKDLQVKVHVSPDPDMSFLEKNFVYRSLSFPDFLSRASERVHADYFLSENEVYYLRSVGTDRRAREVADIETHFPQIADDLRLPPLFPREDFFSSVLRISSQGVRVWTHYDIMDNALIQIVGEKRVVLFEPGDASRLYLRGDKSPILDIEDPDLDTYPDFALATRYRATLSPGDALFIPALWFHNTVATSFSVSVNTFWKNLSHSLYDPSDVYGNKDLLPASKGLGLVEKALGLFDTLPSDYREFYIQRAIISLQNSLSQSLPPSEIT